MDAITLGRVNVLARSLGVLITGDASGYAIERPDGTVLYAGIPNLIRVRTLLHTGVLKRP